jgi:predicted metal-dependent HD superfamily phosphohydrolase
MDSASLDNLHARWRRTLYPFGAGEQVIERAFSDLVDRYGEAGRHYHTAVHIAAVLDTFESSGNVGPALQLAAWYHDAIYNSRMADNEERSADLARTELAGLGLPPEMIAETARLIVLTKTHRAALDDESGQRLIDADLSILGPPPRVYDRYADAIRREYAWVAEADYRAGRTRVLEGFLARPRLYFLLTRAEQPARENLRRELKSLARK